LSLNSFEALTYIAKNIKKYPEDCLSTILVIADHMPYSFPAIAIIAREIGKCEKTVQRKIKKLENKGLLKVIRRHRNSSIYTLILEDSMVSVKKSLGDKSGGSWETNSTSLGDSMVSLQQTKNKQIKEDDLLNNNKSKEAIEDRKNFVKNCLKDNIKSL